MSDNLDPRYSLSRSLDASRLDEDDFIINDVALRIPASEIYVEKRAYNESYQTMRTRKSRKIKSGNSVARIAFSVVFRLSNPIDQNNLIRLVAGLRATPFCVIWNAHLERVLGHPGRPYTSETSSLQPTMLGLTSMTFETMGHEGSPDCCRGSFDFLYFNYLPYTPYIAFKKTNKSNEPQYPWQSLPIWEQYSSQKGTDFSEPGFPWESSLWQAFYAPYVGELKSVNWPHTQLADQTTLFGWREFVVMPREASVPALAAAKDLANALKQKPKEAIKSLQSIVDDSLKHDEPGAGLSLNPELLDDNTFDVFYRKLLHDGVINPNDEIANKIAALEKGEITKVSKDILLPIVRNMYHAKEFTDQHREHADVAGKLLAERLQQKEQQGEGIENINSPFGTLLLDGTISVGEKKEYGGIQLYGRKRFYKIIHQATQDYDTGPSAIIQRIVVSFQNIISVIPMAGHLYPTLQHMGSVDASVSFSINARQDGAHDINAIYDTVETMALRFKQIPAGLTNLYIKNDFLALFGLSEFITENIATTTLQGQPDRSSIELQLSEAGLTSEDKEDDPEQIVQEFIQGSAEALRLAWETIAKHLEIQSNSKGHDPKLLDYYLLKTIKVKRDGSQAILASVVDDARDAYNNFFSRLHKAIVEEGQPAPSEKTKLWHGSGDSHYGFQGQARRYTTQKGWRLTTGTLYKLLDQLNQNSSELGFIPGLDQMLHGIKQRENVILKATQAQFSTDKQKSSSVGRKTPQEMLAAKLTAKNLGKQEVDIQKELVEIARQKRDLDKIGLSAYQLRMRHILQKAIDNKEDPSFQSLQAITEKEFLGKGKPAYSDFKKQLISVAGFLGDISDPKNPGANILKYNPDCYFWYPHLDGSGASPEYLTFIDPSIITQAKAHSLDVWNNAQPSIDNFFQNEYQNRIRNPQNMGPYEVMMEQSEGKLATPLYSPENSFTNTASNKNPAVAKSIIPDAGSRIHTNWYPNNTPLIQSNKILYHSTNVNLLWNGVEHDSHPGSAFAGAIAQGNTKAISDTPGTQPSDLGSSGSEKPPFQLMWPVKPIPISLPEGYLFGRSTRHYGGHPPRRHGGLDMPNKSQGRAPWGERDGIYGQPVYAAASGTVIAIKDLKRVGGLAVFIKHKSGWTHEYMHLMPGSIRVEKNSSVNAGTIIAQIGRTGVKSSPTHLHFQIKNPKRQVIDPLIALPPMKGGQTGVSSSHIPYSSKSAADVGLNLASPLMRSIEGIEESMLKGQYQSLMRAYPAFKLYFIEDDSGERRKYMFDDFFSYSAVQSIRVVRSRKIPADLCEIYLTNISGVLSNKKFDRVHYEGGQRKNTKPQESLSPMQAGTAEENPIASLMLQEGIQISLRMGYMNDPDDLETVFNGIITEVEFSENEDLVRILAQSYAIELVQDIKGFEKPQTKSARRWFGWEFWGFSQDATTGRILEEMLAEPEVLHFGRWDPTANTGATYARELLTQRWTWNPQPQDDNIFAPDPEEEKKLLAAGWIFRNLKYVIYKTTIWDIFQEMTLRHPNFVASVVPYQAKGQQRSTAFFGLPNQLYFARDPKPEEEQADKKLIQEQKKAIQKDERGTVVKIKDALVGASITALGKFIGNKRSADLTANYLQNSIISAAMANPLFRKSRLTGAQDAGYIAPFRGYHLITSSSHLIHNGIKANSRGVANTVVINYNKKTDMADKISNPIMSIIADAAEYSFVLKLDNALPTEEIQTVVGQFVNVTTEETAKRYALSILCQNLKDIYKGEIITIGMPKVKPIDICYLMDEPNSMVGAFEVEEVQHLFSQQDGFRTAIKPDMIVQAAEWSLLSSNEAISIVIEGIVRKYGPLTAMSTAFPTAFPVLSLMTKGFCNLFFSQKICNLTQLGQPVIMAPMTHHGKIFAGGVPTRKIPTSKWFTGDSKWNPTIDAGYYGWFDEKMDEIGGWLKKITLQRTVGNFFNNGGDSP